ncbi:MAG: hypothetical protein ABMA64_26705 [Myxococcota bacterium]
MTISTSTRAFFHWATAVVAASITCGAAPARAADEEPVEQVTVWSEAIENARRAVEAQVVALGYDRVRDKGDRTVYRNELTYKGKVVLYDDGRLETLRTGLRGRKMDPIPGTRIRPYFLCAIQITACVDAGSWYLSERRWKQTEDRVATATAAPLGSLGDRLADAAVADRVAELPDRLDALWQRGEPLTAGDPPLDTYQLRRRALLAFWDSRTETEWGRSVRATVEAFVRGEVQRSDHPFTPTEQAAFEQARRSSTPFPWDPGARPPEP